MDMLVNLSRLPEVKAPDGVHIVRVQPPDRGRMLAFVEKTFGQGWASECGMALSFLPCRCFAAVRDGEPIGFSCYDATAKGFFGPIGLSTSERGHGTGAALLVAALQAMREVGYGYAVIGWCDEAQDFYRKTVNAIPIPGSEPTNSVYRELFRFQNEDA